jgi:hypothetical protein
VSDFGQGLINPPLGGSSTLLENDPLPTDEQHAEMLVQLPRRVKDVLTNDDPDALLASEYFKLLIANSALVQRYVRKYHRDRDREIIADVGSVSMKLAMLRLRAWLFNFAAVHCDNWCWKSARMVKGWIRIPCVCAKTPGNYLRLGYERRCAPTYHQMLPGIPQFGHIPESRDGCLDSMMTRLGSNSGCQTFEFTRTCNEQHLGTGAANDIVGDGCVCYLPLEMQVLPTCTSHDSKFNSYGGVFYQREWK